MAACHALRQIPRGRPLGNTTRGSGGAGDAARFLRSTVETAHGSPFSTVSSSSIVSSEPGLSTSRKIA